MLAGHRLRDCGADWICGPRSTIYVEAHCTCIKTSWRVHWTLEHSQSATVSLQTSTIRLAEAKTHSLPWAFHIAPAIPRTSLSGGSSNASQSHEHSRARAQTATCRRTHRIPRSCHGTSNPRTADETSRRAWHGPDICSLHQPDLARRYFDRTIEIADGTLVSRGTHPDREPVRRLQADAISGLAALIGSFFPPCSLFRICGH